MRFALFREVPKRQRRQKRKLNNGGAIRKGSDGSDNDSDDEEESDDEEDAQPGTDRMGTPTQVSTRAAAAAAPARAPVDPIWGDESQDTTMHGDGPQTLSSSSTAVGVANGKVHPDRCVRCHNPLRTGSCLL